MGLSIHYRGRIRDSKKLPELIDEVTDIVKSNGWDYTLFVEALPQDNAGKKLFEKYPFGLCFSPPECEPVFICFMTDGRMISPVDLEYFEVPPDDRTEESLRYISVKTQYAGKEVHKTIINMFRHLNEKYFKNFSMSDESGYWETGDEKVLEKQFDLYNGLMNSFEQKLREVPKPENETVENYITRIAQSIKDENQKGKD